MQKRTRFCRVCGKLYEKVYKYSESQWSNSKYCSMDCSAKAKRIASLNKKPVYKTCTVCKKIYEKNRKYSLQQWSHNKFCSVQCSAKSKRIRDGMTNDERSRRKRGSVKRYTPEWYKKIKATTKEGMARPEVQEKIRRPRGAQSLERRIKQSNALAGKMPKNMVRFSGNAHYPNVRRGQYECSKGEMYFRSMWEANYALFLDYLKEKNEIADWEYEVDVFMFDAIKLGTRSYRPDFKVFNHDGSFEYHEVKGYMDSKSKTKLKRMAKYYPEVKLILIDSAYYRDLKKKLGKVLNFYE